MRPLIIFCCFAALLHPAFSCCEQSAELVETLACGSINWTSGVLTAAGMAEPLENADDSQSELIQRAHRQALLNLLDVLSNIKIDDQFYVRDLIKADQSLNARLLSMAQNATVLDPVHLPDGSFVITLQMQLSGAFAQLILPVEIRQVEAIKPITQNESVSDANPGDPSGGPESTAVAEVYSGLIVDARGNGAPPAMVPLILDENGRELYGPAFISREYAVQQGTCEYARSLDNPGRLDRVGPNPLVIKGLRAKYKQSCDILVSTVDAARLRAISAHLNFLRQCRVVIVLD
jgi:hypothetical protein